jgi:Mn2+/Fe2+ NRAMP family transporter
MILVGVLGTTISPYLFFWQASEEVEEEMVAGRKTIKHRLGKNLEEVKKMRWDTIFGMVFSNLATFFIIFAAAETLFKNGITNIETAAQAATALRPFAGDWAFFFFTLGIIGTGLLGIPVLAGSAAYGLSEALKLRASLELKWSQAHGFYTIIAVSTLVGLLLNFIGINPMQALVYAAVLNGVIAVPLIFVIMKISNSQKIMGEMKNGPLAKTLGWLTFGVMGLAAGVMIVSLIFNL